MKRWLTHLTISAYLAALAFGLVAHTFKYKQSSHPAMYYVVWDMFCGWSAYALRQHVIAEGISGKYYDVSSGPWGEFQPMGPLARQHYDTGGIHFDRISTNVLKQTEHEPIVRIYCVEEAWAKRFNMPESVWQARYGTPKEKLHRYYHLWQILKPDGSLAVRNSNFLTFHSGQALLDNPRLVADMRSGNPFFTLQPNSRLVDSDSTDQRSGPPKGQTSVPNAN